MTILENNRHIFLRGNQKNKKSKIYIFYFKGDPMEVKFFTMKQTAKMLNLSYLTVFRKVKSREIPTVKVSKKTLIPASFFNSLEQKAMQSMAV